MKHSRAGAGVRSPMQPWKHFPSTALPTAAAAAASPAPSRLHHQAVIAWGLKQGAEGRQELGSRSSRRLQSKLLLRTCAGAAGQDLPDGAPLPDAKQQEQAAHVEDFQRLYTSQLFTPERWIGPVDVRAVAGRGACLHATRDVGTGELLLCVPALSVVYGPSGKIPSNEDLADALLSQQLSPEQLRWLQLLHMDRAPSADSKPQQPSMDPLTGAGGTETQPSGPGSAAQGAGAGASRPTLDQQVLELRQLLLGTWQPPPAPADQGTSAPSNSSSTSSQGPDRPTAADAAAQLASASAGGPLQHSPLAVTPQKVFPPGTLLRPVGLVGTQQGATLSQSGLSRQWVLEAVACNTAGESTEDIAAGQLREVEPLQAFCGLWPEFALLNHSCAPNTQHMAVSGMLLLRAAKPVLEGQELTTCYLGRDRFQTVSMRRATLKQQYGFHCRCRRCLLEQQLYPTRRYSVPEQGPGMEEGAASELPRQGGILQTLLDTVFGAGRFVTSASRKPSLLAATNQALATELEPEAQEALAALTRGPQRRRQLMARLRAVAQEVAQDLQEQKLSSQQQLMLKASVYRLYRLGAEYSELAQEEPQVQVELLQQAVSVMDAVARGSDAHLYLAARWQQRVTQVKGPASVEARQAQLACASAHQARYGKVPGPILQQLVQVRQRQALGAALGQRLSVLTWDTSLGEGGGL